MRSIGKRIIGIYTKLRLITDLLSLIRDVADNLSWVECLL